MSRYAAEANPRLTPRARSSVERQNRSQDVIDGMSVLDAEAADRDRAARIVRGLLSPVGLVTLADAALRGLDRRRVAGPASVQGGHHAE